MQCSVQCSEIQCNTLFYSAVYKCSVQCSAILYITVQCNSVVYNAVQYFMCTVQCNSVVYNAVQYISVQCSVELAGLMTVRQSGRNCVALHALSPYNALYFTVLYCTVLYCTVLY